MKKIICLIMAVLMLGTLFAGCGEGGTSSGAEDNGDKVTLTMVMPWTLQEDYEKVVDEINKKLETLLPNTELSIMNGDGFAEKWSLWMSSRKVIDIAHSGYNTVIEDEVRKDSYLELNELVKEYAPNITEWMEKYPYLYDMAKINGELYAIPNIQNYPKETIALRISKEIASHLDAAALTTEAYSSDKTTEKFWQILTAGLEKAEKNGVTLKSEVDPFSLYDIAKRGYNMIGGADSNLCYDNSDSGEILDFYATDEFKTYCEYTKKWAAKGWISTDILTSKYAGGVRSATTYRGKVDSETKELLGFTDNSASTSRDFDLNNPEKTVLTTKIGDNMSYWSIPFTSVNPARAIKFLDLINSEEGACIVNLLAYGIEGTHYEVVDAENGDIDAFDYEGQGSASNKYGVPNWLVGNMQLMYNVAPYTHTVKEYAANYYEGLNSAKKHIFYGYNFEIDSIRNNLSNVLKNNSEYAPSLFCGVLNNTDGLYEELVEKNKTAGIEDIKAAFQKQADEYIKNNK